MWCCDAFFVTKHVIMTYFVTKNVSWHHILSQKNYKFDFTVFLSIKTSSQNISITALLQNCLSQGIFKIKPWRWRQSTVFLSEIINSAFTDLSMRRFFGNGAYKLVTELPKAKLFTTSFERAQTRKLSGCGSRPGLATKVQRIQAALMSLTIKHF